MRARISRWPGRMSDIDADSTWRPDERNFGISCCPPARRSKKGVQPIEDGVEMAGMDTAGNSISQLCGNPAKTVFNLLLISAYGGGLTGHIPVGENPSGNANGHEYRFVEDPAEGDGAVVHRCSIRTVLIDMPSSR